MTGPGDPADAQEQSDTPPWSDAELKTGEKYLDFVKSEHDRVVAEFKAADDRTRGNAALSAAAIPVIALLRPDPPILLATYATWVCVVGVLLSLACTLIIIGNRATTRTDFPWFDQVKQEIYEGDVLYMQLLRQMQEHWIDTMGDLLPARDNKYRWLGRQQVALIVVFLPLAVLLITVVGHG